MNRRRFQCSLLLLFPGIFLTPLRGEEEPARVITPQEAELLETHNDVSLKSLIHEVNEAAERGSRAVIILVTPGDQKGTYRYQGLTYDLKSLVAALGKLLAEKDGIHPIIGVMKGGWRSEDQFRELGTAIEDAYALKSISVITLQTDPAIPK